jgi:hypothetical protein
MIRKIPAFLGILFLAMVAGGALADDKAGTEPVVVELFTSQGCSSCPPAEAFLNELAPRKDVIALEFHVDYWDYIGWKDAFAKPGFTKRQKDYVSSLKGRYSYTPQMVIDGRAHVVGSHRDEVESLIERYRAEDAGGPVVKINYQDKDELVDVSVGADSRETGTYDVMLFTFDKPHTTDVRRGENRGRVLTNANVVREMIRLGTWSGKAQTYKTSLSGKDGNGGCAVVVQKHDLGPVLAAAKVSYDH